MTPSPSIPREAERPWFRACWRVPTEYAAARVTRERVRAHLTSWGLDPTGDDVAVLLLLSDEVLANAIQHGTGLNGSAQSLFVVLCARQGEALFGVTDGSHAEPVVKPFDGLSESGRGMALIDNLADRWGTYPTEHGKLVWVAVLMPGQPTAPRMSAAQRRAERYTRVRAARPQRPRIHRPMDSVRRSGRHGGPPQGRGHRSPQYLPKEDLMDESRKPEEYVAPTLEVIGTLAGLAQGSYSDGQSDDGDYSTVKWHS